MKKNILICTGLYLPGNKGGGPIRSVANLVDAIGDEYNIYIFTGDRDLGDKEPYKNIDINNWNIAGKSKVFYCSPDNMNFKTIKKILGEIEYHIIYLNSFFSTFTVKMISYLKLNKSKSKILIAPRGEFAQAALNMKKVKKSVYISGFKMFLNNNKIQWHATSEHEKNDINRICKNAKVKIISNIGSRNINGISDLKKCKGNVKIAYVSRVAEIKNLDKAIDILNKVEGNIVYNIYGPLEDENYWNICKEKINRLPKNIEVNYKGKLSHDDIFRTLSEYHAFLLPTQGENFGHAIYEAMSSGCVPIISNKTPWVNLQKYNVGWDLDLNNIDSFTEAVQKISNLNDKEYNEMRNNIRKYIENVNANDRSVEKMKLLFE